MSAADPSGTRDPYRKETERTGWYGWIAFAGVMMFILGAFHAIIGAVAIFDNDYYQVGTSELVIEISYNAWGWIHLILGVLVAAAGLALTQGATWARITAVFAASLSALVSMTFLSAQPFWGVILITIDVLIIYAVTAHGDPNSLEGY
jgi:vacuolar-type H+-ATPase subunit I/STV1